MWSQPSWSFMQDFPWSKHKTDMWPDLRKGVFHTHPIYQIWRFLTLDWYKLLTWNFVRSKCQHSLMTGGSFSSICHLIAKLWSPKFRELDACGRPLFANPVTYVALYVWHVFGKTIYAFQHSNISFMYSQLHSKIQVLSLGNCWKMSRLLSNTLWLLAVFIINIIATVKFSWLPS